MCVCVCVTVCVVVCVNHMPKLPMSQENQSYTTLKLGFLTCVPHPGQQQKLFLTENALSKKPLQANMGKHG